MQPAQLAHAVAKAMSAQDPASAALGIELVEIRPGYARMSMRIKSDMLNGHGICHGGLIFMLADTAFAYACNSHNQIALAASCTIDFLQPGRDGELLTAIAEERCLAGRTGIYDIEVVNETGDRIALMRGRAYRVRGEVVDPNQR